MLVFPLLKLDLLSVLYEALVDPLEEVPEGLQPQIVQGDVNPRLDKDLVVVLQNLVKLSQVAILNGLSYGTILSI